VTTKRASVAHFIAWLAVLGTAQAQPPTLDGSAKVRAMPPAMTMASKLPNSPLLRATAQDARLNALAIINEDRLCVVGDRGVVLTTANGGRSWESRGSGTTCNLHAVTFSGNVGWAVGGWIGHLTGLSYGVVLKTVDGGQTWTPLPSEQLTRLTGVGLAGERLVGWGDYNPQLKTSVVESLDGGTTWRGLVTGLGHASAVGLSSGGVWGAIDVLGNAVFSQRPSVQTVARTTAPIYDLLHNRRRWFGCGGAGELITSLDGESWTNLTLPLSSEARGLFDGRAIDAFEDHLWVCGSPGSIVLHSADGGVNWRALPTGQALPLNDLRFIDKKRGWMVGAQGVILATRDGGQTWYAQRQSLQRVGVLSVVQQADAIPWSPLVATAWDERMAAASIMTQTTNPLDRANFAPSEAMRLEAIAPQLGLAQHATWLADNESHEQASRRLAIAILSWRPDVVLTEEKSIGQADIGNGSRLSVVKAMQLAADAGPQLSVASELGLSAWQTSKLVSVCNTASSQYSEQAARVIGDSGLTLWDVLLPLSPEQQSRSQIVPMRTVWARSQATVLQASLLGGVARDPAIVRDMNLGKIGNYQLVMGRIHRQRSLEQVVEQSVSETTDERWREDLRFVLKTLPATELTPAMVQQSQRAMSVGSFTRQRMLLEALVELAPLPDAAAWARFELLRLASSDEFEAWRRNSERDATSSVALASTASAASPVIKQAVWNASPFETQIAGAVGVAGQNGASVTTAAAERALTGNSDKLRPLDEAPSVVRTNAAWFSLLDRLAQGDPALLSRPDTQMLVAHNLLLAHNSTGHIQYLDALAAQSWLVGWSQAARQELQLASNRLESLRWLAFAAQATSPPTLDGEWDEPFWSQVPNMELRQIDGEATTEHTKLAWAYDANYLYIAIDCPRTGNSVPTVAKVRQYDADLSQLDHVQLVLDTDRDYSSVIELGIAENGLTYDRCCGFSAFNPRWHVLVKPDAQRWRAEIAIELAELTTAATVEAGAWAVSARRMIGGQPVESWSSLKTHQPLSNASGLLLFAPAY